MTALWLPYLVDDLDAARRYYVGNLGLDEVDGWRRPGERGAVLRAAGAAYVELVEPGRGSAEPVVPGGPPGAALLAFELPDGGAVDAARASWRHGDPPGRARRYPRGHYGFEAAGPAGTTIMVWSER